MPLCSISESIASWVDWWVSFDRQNRHLPRSNSDALDLQWAMYAWRSIYFSEQVSSRTKALLMADWIIRGIWGRDLSRI